MQKHLFRYQNLKTFNTAQDIILVLDVDPSSGFCNEKNTFWIFRTCFISLSPPCSLIMGNGEAPLRHFTLPLQDNRKGKVGGKARKSISERKVNVKIFISIKDCCFTSA